MFRRAQMDTLRGINAINNDGWTRIAVAVDSGACDNVIGPETLTGYGELITETNASINGQYFISATGDPIKNYGQLKIPVVTREGTTKGMTFQAAGVAKPLAAVEKLNESGHDVIFSCMHGAFIHNQATGEVNALRKEEGNFMLDLWVPPSSMAIQAGFCRHP